MEEEEITSTQASEESENTRSSILSNDSSDERYIEIPYKIVAGKRKNSQLLWSITEKQFYKRNCEMKNGTAYLCIDKSCKIRVYLRDQKCFKLNKQCVHNHGPNDELEYRCRVANEIKSKILLLEYNKMSNREVYNDVLSRNQNCTLKFEEIERTLQHIRSSAIPPPPPQNASETTLVLKREEFYNENGKTKSHVKEMCEQHEDQEKPIFIDDVNVKSSKPTDAQKRAMIRFIEQNTLMNSSQQSTDLTLQEHQNLWKKLANQLNKMSGSNKVWRKWKRCWIDIKKGVSLKQESNKIYKLTEIEERVKKFTENLYENTFITASKMHLKKIVRQSEKNKINKKSREKMFKLKKPKNSRRGPSMSKTQKEMLTEFMKEKQQLRHGIYDDSLTKEDARLLWEYVGSHLNLIEDGTKKEWYQWRKTWHDIKYEVKKKIKNVKELSEIDKKILCLAEDSKLEKDVFNLPLEYKIPNISLDDLKNNIVKIPNESENFTISTEQKILLAKFMQENPKLGIEKLSEKFTSRDSKKLWEIVTVKLNTIEKVSEKTIYQWKKCWNRMKTEIKKKYREHNPLSGFESYVNEIIKCSENELEDERDERLNFPDEDSDYVVEPENNGNDDNFLKASKCAILYFYDKSRTFYIKCDKCEEVFTNFSQFSMHYIDMHFFASNMISNELYNSEVFPVSTIIDSNNIKKKVDEIDVKIEVQDYVISECSEEKNQHDSNIFNYSDNDFNIEQSLQNEIKKNEQSLQNEDLKKLKKIVKKTKNVIKCIICERQCISFRQKFMHDKIYHSDELLFCKIRSCLDTFRTQNEYERHLESNHTSNPKLPYKCPHCIGVEVKSFSSRDKFTAHIQRIHMKEKNFECRHCGKQFFDRKETFEHESTHTGLNQQICHYCGYTTIYRHNLLKHIRTLHKPPEFLCETCNKTFALKSSLIKHQKSMHTAEKPFICSICGAAFGCKTYLKKHIYNQHEVDYRCTKCGKKFWRKNKLNQHIEANVCGHL